MLPSPQFAVSFLPILPHTSSPKSTILCYLTLYHTLLPQQSAMFFFSKLPQTSSPTVYLYSSPQCLPLFLLLKLSLLQWSMLLLYCYYMTSIISCPSSLANKAAASCLGGEYSSPPQDHWLTSARASIQKCNEASGKSLHQSCNVISLQTGE